MNTKSILIDTHCHLDRYDQQGSLEKVMERARHAGVERMIAVGTEASDWGLYQRLATEWQGRIFYSVGLHPCHVADDWQTQISQLPAFFSQTQRPVALGEIGLDYFHLPKNKTDAETLIVKQKQAFKEQLEIALNLKMPTIIHSRSAFLDTVAMIDRSGFDWKSIVYHCFSEGPDEVALINERGGRASFTGILTYKNAEIMRQALKRQGIERLMIETDAPYLAPTPHRGKENEPAFVSRVAVACAELLGVDDTTLANVTTHNAIDFFQLPLFFQ